VGHSIAQLVGYTLVVSGSILFGVRPPQHRRELFDGQRARHVSGWMTTHSVRYDDQPDRGLHREGVFVPTAYATDVADTGDPKS
jgi:hypothetical protein